MNDWPKKGDRLYTQKTIDKLESQIEVLAERLELMLSRIKPDYLSEFYESLEWFNSEGKVLIPEANVHVSGFDYDETVKIITALEAVVQEQRGLLGFGSIVVDNLLLRPDDKYYQEQGYEFVKAIDAEIGKALIPEAEDE